MWRASCTASRASLDGKAQTALDQIDSHGYALPFAVSSRHVIKIGANFSTKTRTIGDWLVEY